MLKPKDCRAIIGGSEYYPLMIGGMGVDVSTSAMVLEAARLGCIAHLSDAMVPAVCDKNFGTTFTKNKAATHLIQKTFGITMAPRRGAAGGGRSLDGARQ